MEIYIKVVGENYGPCWFVAEEHSGGLGSYLENGDNLFDPNTDEPRGSAAKNWQEALNWAKLAYTISQWDGYGKTKVTCWTIRGNKLVCLRKLSRNKLVSITK
jgi:hypothetical protein